MSPGRFKGIWKVIRQPKISPRVTACASAFLAAAALLPALAPLQVRAQDAAAGDRLFRQRCVACHTVQAGQNRIGPHLSGIVGRKAGSVDGVRYSQGMQDLAIAWDAAQLDAYLANPTAMVRGTTMAISVPNAAERASIVAYLQTLGCAK